MRASRTTASRCCACRPTASASCRWATTKRGPPHRRGKRRGRTRSTPATTRRTKTSARCTPHGPRCPRTSRWISCSRDETSPRSVHATCGTNGAIAFLGELDDATLARRYRGALAYVQPSLAEGFGIPALEAAAAGTPVLATTTSVPADRRAVRADVRAGRCERARRAARAGRPRSRASARAGGRGRRHAAGVYVGSVRGLDGRRLSRGGMPLTRSLVAAVLAVCVAAWAVPASAAPPPRKDDVPIRAIAIIVNGDELARDPAPRRVGGRVLVPVVRIYSALGINVARDGATLVASAPSKRITITVGSSRATVDTHTIMMDSPAIEIDGATYVPLRFVADSLGAQVTYDPKAERVEVISSVVGRAPGLEQHTPGGSTQIVGTVSAVDLEFGARIGHGDARAGRAHDRDHVRRADRRAGRRDAHQHAGLAQGRARRRRGQRDLAPRRQRRRSRRALRVARGDDRRRVAERVRAAERLRGHARQEHRHHAQQPARRARRPQGRRQRDGAAEPRHRREAANHRRARVAERRPVPPAQRRSPTSRSAPRVRCAPATRSS